MIKYFDMVLGKLLERNLGWNDNQIGFCPPDEDWRNKLQGSAINIYLVDLRENHARRTNTGVREIRNGVLIESAPPRWLDCHYLITAWDSSSSSLLIPTLEEHGILSSVAAILLDAETKSLTPRQIFASETLPPGFPAAMADATLPPFHLPAEGFPKLAEFWGTMGTGNRWKPAVYLVAVLPVIRADMPLGPPVTTVVTEYGQAAAEETETLLEIGGSVLDTKNPLPDKTPAPVSGATVRLETPGGGALRETLTDGDGCFVFSGLIAGSYILRALAGEVGEKSLTVQVSATPHGTELIKYDISF